MKDEIIYILPGGAGSGKVEWYQWLEQELRKKGCQSIVVCSQNRISPFLRAKILLKKYRLTTNSIVIGHSFGGLTALKWIELANKRITGLVLIDTSMKSVFETPALRYLKTLPTNVKRKKEEESRIVYLRSWNWIMSLKKVKDLVSKSVVVGEIGTTKMFEGWNKGQNVYAKKLGAKLIWAKGQKTHFTAKKEPQILKSILTVV